jgi:hypothetical protein
MGAAEKGLDRARRIPQRRVAITTLLVEEAEPRIQLLQAPQGFKRLVYAVQASLVGGDQVQEVAVLGRCNRERFSRDECFGVPSAFAELTDTAYLEFDW